MSFLQSKTTVQPGNTPQKPCSSNIREMVGQGGRDWTQPITARGSELAQAIAEATAAGWTAHKMKVLPEVIYELQFFRLAGTAEAGKQFREPSETARPQGSPCSPAHI